MAVGVNIPQRRQEEDGLGKILKIGSMVAPMFGPAGMAVGAGMGVAGALNADNKQNTPGPEAIQTGPSDAMGRRMQSLQESPQMQIANSIDSLKYIQDPQQRAELAKPLMQADYMARNKQA